MRLCYGLESIGENAFYKCLSLENISIPSSVKSIGRQAFWQCEKLKVIALPEGMTTPDPAAANVALQAIGTATFAECLELQAVYIPANITAIGYNTFNICSKLKSIIFGGTADQWRAITKDSNWITNDNNKYCVYCSDFYLTEADNKYSYTQPNSVITHYVVPPTSSSLNTGVLNSYTNLVSITIPSSVKTVEPNVFTNITKLATVFYKGSRADWNNINIASGNDYLLKAKLVTLTDSNIRGTLNTTDIVKGPFMYICKDTESASSPASNKMFLKLPGYDEIIEISKGAARLESTESAVVQGYYTYETLAAIIAGINTRLEGLGGGILKLPTTLPATNSVIIPDGLHATVLDDTFKTDAIPTIQDLSELISGLRDDLEDLAGEVDYELNGEAIAAGLNSRLDYIERAFNYHDNTITLDGETMTAKQFKKLLHFIDSIADEYVEE